MKDLTRRSFLAVMGSASLAACGGAGGGTDAGSEAAGSGAGAAGGHKVEMVTDVGGVNDQSFNELAWAGMQVLGEEGYDVAYLESKQDADYKTNLDKAVDDGSELVWGVGFLMGDVMKEAAETYPDVKFAIIDNTYEEVPPNLTGVAFKQEECSFAVGYVAARMSKSGKVGFIGGIDSEVMQQFEQGYYAGIEYANKEHDLKVTYEGQWTDSFSDAALGKSTAEKQIANGCDVIYHAAGGVGAGMIEACKEAGIFAIGVDQDQSHLAPEAVVTSALKRVDMAIVNISKAVLEEGQEGGTNITLGAAEDAVGIAPTHDLMDKEAPGLYEDTLAVIDKIKAGDIVVPKSAAELEEYKKSLA